MSRNWSILTRFLAVALVATAQPLFADDTKPAPPPSGYKDVNLGEGKIRVKDAPDPYKNVSSHSDPDKYQPDQPDYTRKSQMADKAFSSNTASTSRKTSGIEQSSFITKPYGGDAKSPNDAASNFSSKATLPTANVTGTGSHGFDKSFSAAKADVGKNKTPVFTTLASNDQNRTATYATDKTETFASLYSGKSFTGPEADNVKKDVQRLNAGLMEMKDLPDRPLTIDEVRALINHGAKPHTDEAPADPPSKPLNDPDYKRVPSPAIPDTVVEDDKNDAIPAPGTMAAPQTPPENIEQLPQH